MNSTASDTKNALAFDSKPNAIESLNASHDGSLVRWMLETMVRQVWKMIISVVGITILLLGVVMIFTPGPAIVLIPMGLGILAIEFLWARRMLRRIKVQTRRKLRQLKQGTP